MIAAGTHGRLRITAFVTAHHEDDIVVAVVRALLADGVDVYVLDRGLSNGTARELETFRNSGLIGVDQLSPHHDPAFRDLAHALTRTETLAQELDADWFIRVDADAFLESPWDNGTLGEAIARVDACGYTAIAAEVFNFLPTTADRTDCHDVRERFEHYDPAWLFNQQQIVSWKKGPYRISLTPSRGQDVQFATRTVFPINLPLRHYPVRQPHAHSRSGSSGSAQYEAPGRSPGWHVYDDPEDGLSFVRDPAALVKYDPASARLALWTRHRGVERLERVAAANGLAADQLVDERNVLFQELGAARLELAQNDRTIAQLLGSRSWMLTKPLRVIDRLLRRR